ncbi:hypothetical protein EPO33_02145 [Patescibacteria group bacterium]|nr:MAG: hypothetical protein EPO33_02145 [Patescibacteria group bacterium]
MAKEGRSITEISQGRAVWMHLSATGPKELDVLRRRFRFPEADLRDIPPPTQRPKAALRDAYTFVILLFPTFDRAKREIQITEADFFIGKDYLVTVNQGNRIRAMTELVGRCSRDAGERRACMSGSPVQLFTLLLDQMLGSVFPMLVHIGEDIDNLEGDLFDAQNTRLIHDILRVKSNVTNCRRAMMAYKHIIERVHLHGSPAGKIPELEYHRLLDMTKEVWNLLESHKETLDALQETNISLISMRTNEIMRTLTVFSVILLPLSLIVGVFGMNVEYPGVIGGPYGFFFIVATIGAIAVGLVAFFRKQRWF